jgi:hypothetical protein
MDFPQRGEVFYFYGQALLDEQWHDRWVLTVQLIFHTKSLLYGEVNKVENLLVKFDSYV